MITHLQLIPKKPESKNVEPGKITTFYGRNTIESLVETNDGTIIIESFTHEDEDRWEIGFRVDGQFSVVKRPKLTPEDRKLISKTINYDTQRLLQRLPDSALLINEPYTNDGKQKIRARLYERYGFGKLQENGAQYAIKEGNTITPQNSISEFTEGSSSDLDDIEQLIYDILFGDSDEKEA